MNCEQVQELLPDYLAGELEGEQAELVRRHLAGCAECTRAVKLVTAERAFLEQGLRQESPPRSLRQELEGAIAESAPPAPSRWLSLQALARIAALFLCAAGIATFVLLLRTPKEVVTPDTSSEEVAAQVEQLLADISHLAAKVEVLRSRPILWDDQNGRFPRLTATASRSQEHLIQQDREALAALTLAAARLREAAGDIEGTRTRRQFVLACLADTCVAQRYERSKP